MAKPKQPPPPSSSSSSSSSSSDDSPPPAISTTKKPAPLSPTPLQQNPSSKPIFQPEEEQKDNSETEDTSTEEESSENSDHPAPKSNPPPTHPTPISQTESEDGEEDSSSESEQQPPPPPPQPAPVKFEENKSAPKLSASDSASEDESENSSDSDTIPPPPPPRISSRNTADPSLKPLNSKPMDSAVQSPDKSSPVSKKRSVNNPAEISDKKRKMVHVVKADGGPEKKEITRRIWSKADELVLLQSVLDFIEQHHGTSTPAQVESLLKSQAEALLKSVNDSKSSSVTLTQMNDKIRRLRQKYNATAKKVKDVSNPNISNAHDAAVFDLSRKIWGSGKKEPVLSEKKFNKDKLKTNKLKEGINEEKGKTNLLAVEYPFLRWHAKNDHVKSALVVQSRIPTREAEVLEGSCKKLEITEVQLHMKKMKLLSLSLKLIEDALAKL